MGAVDEAGFREKRKLMVERQIRLRGVDDPGVLTAMLAVPRHRFVPPSALNRAYEDYPLSIGYGQTISQPYIVARMTQLLAVGREDVVLEVGAGCGYQSAVLAELARQVYAVELVPELAETARANLQELGYTNVEVGMFDGSSGWPEKAPFNRVLVAAGAPKVPEPLKEQLAEQGRLVLPVGQRHHQELVTVIRDGDTFQVRPDILCRFVDLKGEHGWS